MYYLDQKLFKPAMILLSIPFVPNIIALIIASTIFLKIELLVILFIILIVYIFILIVLYKASRNKKHYLLIQNDNMEICFNDIFKGETKLNLYYSEIKK